MFKHIALCAVIAVAALLAWWPQPMTQKHEADAQKNAVTLASFPDPDDQPVGASSRHDDAARERCSAQTIQALYRALTASEWLALNDWQQQLGLNKTRLLANGELTQEPASYLQMNESVLVQLAKQNDADAAYWLAIQWQQSTQTLVRYDNVAEDKHIVIPRLLQQAALLGHVPAMQAMTQSLQQNIAQHGSREQFPDWAIQARAWQWLIAWRMQQTPEPDDALNSDNESQALTLAQQLSRDIEQRRATLQLPALNNQRPDVVVRLEQQQSSCEPTHSLATR